MNNDIVNHHTKLQQDIRQLVAFKHDAVAQLEETKAKIVAADTELNALLARKDQLEADIEKAVAMHKKHYIETAEANLTVWFSTRLPKWFTSFVTKHIKYVSIDRAGQLTEWSK